MRSSAFALFIALFTLTTGCSGLIGRAPSKAAWDTLESGGTPPADACTRTGPMPYVDTAFAIFMGIATAALVLDEASSSCDGPPFCMDNMGYVLAVPTGLVSVVSGMSAVRGFEINEECNDYHARWDAKWGGRPSR